MFFHYRQVYGITCGHPPTAQDNFLGTLSNSAINRQDLINYPEECVERRLNSIMAADGDIAVQNLLKDLGIGHQSLAIANQSFKQSLRVALVGMRRTHQIHRNVRINQNHGRTPVPYPFSISASML